MWTGQITVTRHVRCEAHVGGARKKTDVGSRLRASVCSKKGAQYVLVVDGKTYRLMNHDADLKAHAGHTVNLTGDLTGETIRVAKIEMLKGALVAYPRKGCARPAPVPPAASRPLAHRPIPRRSPSRFWCDRGLWSFRNRST